MNGFYMSSLISGVDCLEIYCGIFFNCGGLWVVVCMYGLSSCLIS